MKKWLGLVVVIVVAVGAVWYFTVYQPRQQAYATLQQAAQNASDQYQRVADRAQEAGVPLPTTTTTSPAQSSEQSTSADTHVVTVSNSQVGASFSVEVPSLWQKENATSWSRDTATYVTLSVPRADAADMPRFTLEVAESESDPSTIDSTVQKTLADSASQLGNVTIKKISIPGANGAFLSSGTSDIKGTSFLLNTVVAYKIVTDSYGSSFVHTYTINFSAEKTSPSIVAAQRALGTVRILQ